MAPEPAQFRDENSTHDTSRRKGLKRTARACDECRMRKSKCDGLQPCEACQTTERYCTYNLSAGRSASSSTRIRILEDRLRRARAYLNEAQQRTPSLAHVNFDALLGPTESPSPSKQISGSKSHGDEGDDEGDGDDDDQHEKLDSMLSSYGQLTVEDDGNATYDFYGAGSGLAFIQKTHSFFQNRKENALPDNEFDCKHSAVVQLFDAPLPPKQALKVDVPVSQLLPPRQVAFRLLRTLFTMVYPLYNFLNEKSFSNSMERLYDLAPIEYHESDHEFIPLFYAVVGLGYMFSREDHDKFGCRLAISQGMRHFIAARSMIDVTNTRSLVGLQTVLCLILFLVSTARVASAHAYMSLATAAAMRQGLHFRSSHDASISQEARDVRRRVFWAVVGLDMYINGILGLPNFIDLATVDPAIDMTIETALKDVQQRQQMSSRENLLLSAAAKNIEVLRIIKRANSALFPKPPESPEMASGKGTIKVSVSKLEKVEVEFQQWAKSVAKLLPTNDEDEELRSVRYELEMTYYFGHIILYRAFLHHLTIKDGNGRIGGRQMRYARKCIKVASKAISLSIAHQEQGLLCPASWPSLYTVFLATVCLIFALATQDSSVDKAEDQQEIENGIRLLASTACTTDTGSVRCLEILRTLIGCISYSINIDLDQVCKDTKTCCTIDFSAQTPPVRERVQMDTARVQNTQSTSSASSSTWMSPTRQRPDLINAMQHGDVDDGQALSSLSYGQGAGPSFQYLQPSQHYLSPSGTEDLMEVMYRESFAWPNQNYTTDSSDNFDPNQAASMAQQGGPTAEDIAAFMQINPGDVPFRRPTQ